MDGEGGRWELRGEWEERKEGKLGLVYKINKNNVNDKIKKE